MLMCITCTGLDFHIYIYIYNLYNLGGAVLWPDRIFLSLVFLSSTDVSSVGG